uniref:Uncharacterized protein n=1 Tax=Amphiprion percula TaxID=161767 RepID=A0A3P8TMZ0_AMPPE
METAVDKHRGISQRRCHDTSGHAEVSLGCFANRKSVSEDRTSPTNSADLFPTPASSRESILSEGLDRDKSWSAAQLSSVASPVSFSRTVSQCSSVRSGVFTPAVVQIKRHFLAPGSSLVNIPQTCFSSCESLTSSVCLETSPPRHRPPLTRLSLLTAILRKGRLPVLSPAPQRPYTPCWPVNPVTLSFCNACSAASSVASIPLEFSSLYSSSASIDSQSHVHREANRCITAPPTVQPSELSRTRPQVKRCSEQIHSGSVPRRERVVSPPPVKSSTLPRAPLFCSNFKSVSPSKHEAIDCAPSNKLPHTHICSSAELKPSNTHMFLKGHADNNLKKLISPSTKLSNEPDTAVPQKWSHQPNSSLSKLHSLSQKLRSVPVSPPHPQLSCATTFSARTDTASPLPALQNVGSEGSCPDSKSVTPSRGFHKASCLSPSRYTPIVFSGWPSPADSPTPTPSPAPPIRDLTPSPPLSLRSTPSPRPGSGISDCSDREGKKRKVAMLCLSYTHKIKSSYKSLAAIPTNTLLLDQQVSSLHLTASLCSLHPSAGVERKLTDSKKVHVHLFDQLIIALNENDLLSAVKLNLGIQTKPGVIRPMTAIPRLTVEEDEELRSNPFRQFTVKQTFNDKKKVGTTALDHIFCFILGDSKISKSVFSCR